LANPTLPDNADTVTNDQAFFTGSAVAPQLPAWYHTHPQSLLRHFTESQLRRVGMLPGLAQTPSFLNFQPRR